MNIYKIVYCIQFPANTKRWNSDGLMLGKRRRRWASITPALVERLVFARIAGKLCDNWNVIYCY